LKESHGEQEAFTKRICSVPPEAIKSLKKLADAEILLEAVFSDGFALKR